MNYQEELNALYTKARQLSEDAKNAFIAYLEQTIDIMAKDLSDGDGDWASLKPLENKEANDFYDMDYVGFIQSYRLDDEEIIDFDRHFLAEIKK